jgi:hypothetical protein
VPVVRNREKFFDFRGYLSADKLLSEDILLSPIKGTVKAGYTEIVYTLILFIPD